MEAVTARMRRGRFHTGFTSFRFVCLGLSLMLIVTLGEALGDSPRFFSVNTEAQLDGPLESALWMTPSLCSGTCFRGPVRLTSASLPVSSVQNHFGQFTNDVIPSIQRGEKSESRQPFGEKPVYGKALPGPAPSALLISSAQNRFGFASAVIPPTARPARAPSSPQRSFDPVIANDYVPPRTARVVGSAQTFFGQPVPDHRTAVRLAQNVSELQPAPAVDSGPSGSESASGSESVSGAESLGSEPENVGILFLRTQTVLLKPRQWQFDTGLSYTIAESDFPVAVVDGFGTVTGVTEGRIRQRLLMVPFEARYGLTRRIQLFLAAPVGYSNTETAYGGVDNYLDTGGIGDVSFGLSAQLIPGTSCRPELVGTFGVTSPTGDASLATTLLTPEAALGEGFWGFTGNLLWVRNYDPVVVFYGVGANFRLDAEFSGIQVDPGERFLYQFGVGFAVNRHLTLSGALLGSYWVEDRWDGVRVAGGIREPLRFRIAATIGKNCRIIEPFAEIGMTEEAPDSRIGITWTF